MWKLFPFIPHLPVHDIMPSISVSKSKWFCFCFWEEKQQSQHTPMVYYYSDCDKRIGIERKIYELRWRLFIRFLFSGFSFDIRNGAREDIISGEEYINIHEIRYEQKIKPIAQSMHIASSIRWYAFILNYTKITFPEWKKNNINATKIKTKNPSTLWSWSLEL